MRNLLVDLNSYSCNLKIVSGGFVLDLPNKVEYRSDLTPKVTSISPRYLQSQGGDVTVQGTNFTVDCSLIIDNVGSTLTNTITSTSPPSFVYKVNARTDIVPHSLVIKCLNGNAALMGNDVEFIDLWSLNATWGDDFLPTEGDSIHVPSGQTLLVDVSPPMLKLVMVEGKMIFQDKNIDFDAHYIVVNGGELWAGLKDSPFKNKLRITLHGEKYDNTMPGMGNKHIGIINGKLYLYGDPRTPTWTSLAETATVGAT